MSKIRVMQVLIDCEIGGTQLLAFDLAEHFAEVETYIACVTGGGSLMHRFSARYPTLIVNTEKDQCHKSFRWFKPIVIIRLANLMRRYNFKIVQTHLFPAAIIGRAAAVIARVPIIIDTMHNLCPWKEPKDLFIDYQLSRWTDMIICNSDATRLFSEKQNPKINPHKFKTIHLGVDVERFNPQLPNWDTAAKIGINSGDIVIVSVSRLVSQKRVGDLIKAAPTILSVFPSVKFLIIGDGPQRKELEDQVGISGLGHAFRFSGFRTDPEKILPFCHIFTQLADREGFGLSMVEAMACGIPVVAALSAPVPEIITNNFNGLTFKIGDINKLSELICILLRDASLRKMLSCNALESVRQKFNIQRTANELERLYQKLLCSKRASHWL